MPTDTEQVDAIARAAAEFKEAAKALHAERARLAQAEEDLAERTEAIERAAREYAEAEAACEEAARLQEALEEEFRALEEALSADVQRVLEEIRAAERGITAARRAYDELDAIARAEHDKATEAGAAWAARDALTEAVAAVHEQAAGFGEFARPDLRSLIGVGDGRAGGEGGGGAGGGDGGAGGGGGGAGGELPHWPDAARWPDPGRASEELAARIEAAASGAGQSGAGRPEPGIQAVLPAGYPEILEAYAAATRGGRQVTEGTLKNAADRMSVALKDFEQALETCDEDYRVDWKPAARAW